MHSPLPLVTDYADQTVQSTVRTPVERLSMFMIQHHCEIERWFRQQWQKTDPPFYASVDLRNSGYQFAPIDTNLFPAGFNNLSSTAKPLAVQAFASLITETCPQVGRLLLIPENHTRNLFYFENIWQLIQLLTTAGIEVRVGTIDPQHAAPHAIQLAGDPPRKLLLEPISREGNRLYIANEGQNHRFDPCMILLNNDLSKGPVPILENVEQPILPPPALGWHKRYKSDHFSHYQEVVKSFSDEFSDGFISLGLTPHVLAADYDVVDHIHFHQRDTLEPLMDRTRRLFERLRQRYEQNHIPHQPYVVIKADTGTYGMAVMSISDTDALSKLNRKARNKLAVGKEGITNRRILIQEGIHSIDAVDGHVAEQVIYTVGRYVVGGFYRLHAQKDNTGILNAPGMQFRDISFEECCNMPNSELPLDNEINRHYVAGVIARLAVLAAAQELYHVDA